MDILEMPESRIRRIIREEISDLLGKLETTSLLISPIDAAKMLGRKPQTLANWRSLGKGPKFTTAGGRVMYRREDIINFVNEN